MHYDNERNLHLFCSASSFSCGDAIKNTIFNDSTVCTVVTHRHLMSNQSKIFLYETQIFFPYKEQKQ
jgi:hypothetical protein